MRTLVGHVGVDSGQVMVGDPCYLADWKDNEFVLPADPNGVTEPTGEYSYDGAAHATCSKDGYGELGNGLAVAVGNFGGDGTFPVYVETDQRGNVLRMIVDFDVSDDEEGEDDEP